MLFGSELTPENVKLRTDPDMLSYLIDVVDGNVADYQLEIVFIIWLYHSRQNVYQSSLSCPVMP